MAHSQTAAYLRRVGDHMAPPPAAVQETSTVRAAVAGMTAAGTSAAVVLDEAGRLVGILTEQDVARRIAGRDTLDQPVAQLMSRPVATVAVDQPLYEAIGFMRRRGLRHMPVVDADGALAGMLYLDHALAAANAGLVEQIDRLTHETTLAGLREVKAAQVELAAALFADRVPAPEIQQLISSINNDLHRRVLGLALADMAAAGWGAPPVAFAAIVMGSGGRGESFLFPDQDNGLILADYPDAEHTRIDAFFIELAERLTSQLDQLGFPLCRGGVMAINPVWRKTLSQWRQQVTRWVARRSEIGVQLADVLFDFRCAFGAAELAAGLRGTILQLTQANPAFLREMFTVRADHRAALGWFGRLLTEREDQAHRGKINLKYAGTLPLAEGVRLLALRAGHEATGTLARLTALAAAGEVSRDVEDALRAAFDHITSLQLRQQISDFQAGRPPSNFVDPATLTARETALLKASFRAINTFREGIRLDFTGEAF